VLQRLRSVYGPEILEEAKVSVFLSEFQWLMDFDGNKLQPSSKMKYRIPESRTTISGFADNKKGEKN
jgi:hypothetical protein